MRDLVSIMRARAAVARRFQLLLERVQPTPSERMHVAAHRATVIQRLTSVMNALAPVGIGSYQRDTAVAGRSDFDLMLPLRANAVRWGDALKRSDTVLNTDREQLMAGRFLNSDIGRDGQAIVITFADGTQIDVVPASFCSFDNGPVYRIPDGNGGWMDTSPARHNAYLKSADASAGGKLKRVVQLLKYWRFTRAAGVPLSSFHVELLLACAGCGPQKPHPIPMCMRMHEFGATAVIGASASRRPDRG